MASQGLLDAGKQKLSDGSGTKIEFNDLGSAEDLILEENRDLEDISSKVSWKRRLLVAALALALLAVFSLALLIAVPKKPEISLVSFEFDENTPSQPDEDGQLLTNWIGKVSVKSSYLFSIGVESIHVKAYLPSNDTTPVGFGHVEDIVVKRLGETLVEMPFKVPVYQPSSGNPSLIEECMNHSKAVLLIKASIDLKLTHWTGKKINQSLTKTVDCALPQLYSLLRKYLGGSRP